MKNFKILVYVFGIASLFLPLHAEWTFDEKGLSELDLTIMHLSDRIYCDAECTGGKNNQKIINEHVESFKLLLQKDNPPVNHLGDGMTPLMRAALENQWEIIDLLLQAGADISIVDSDGRTALDYARMCKNAQWGSYASLVYLIMWKYFTRYRYNKCIDLLEPNVIKRTWRKQWIPTAVELAVLVGLIKS